MGQNSNNSTNNNSSTKNIHMVAPHTKGPGKSFKNICDKLGIQVYFKGGSSIRNLLMAPKDKENIAQKSRVISRYKSNRGDCDEEYIGESSRTFGERLKEHLRAPSPSSTMPLLQGIKPAKMSCYVHNTGLLIREYFLCQFGMIWVCGWYIKTCLNVCVYDQ